MLLGTRTHPALDTLPRLMQDTLFDTELRIRRASDAHLGHPYNLNALPHVPSSLGHHLIANPDADAALPAFDADVCGLEREAVAWLAQAWGRPEDMPCAGFVTASGSEANLWALHRGREALPGAVLLYGAEAHGSIVRAAHMLRITATCVKSTDAGEMDLADLARVLAGLKGRAVILALTCGTPFRGGHDDIAGAVAVLEAHGFGPKRRFIHVDGALNAMVLPFLPAAPAQIRPDFRLGIDSIAICGHKMIGAPMPCGVLICRKSRTERATAVEAGLTGLGPRNGHAVLAIWTRLMAHGVAGFAQDALRCTLRAAEMAGSLRQMGVDARVNPFAMTVVFPQPAEEIVRDYHLPCQNGLAHAIVMPSVSDSLMTRFISDYCIWARDAPKTD